MALNSVSTKLPEGHNFNQSGLKNTKLKLNRGQLGTDLGSAPTSGVGQLSGSGWSGQTLASKIATADEPPSAVSALPTPANIAGAKVQSSTSALPSPANVAGVSSVPKAQPTSSLTEFYRKDGNFYTKDGRYIGPTEFGTGSGFKEISAPTETPAVQDLATVKPTETVKDLSMASVSEPTTQTLSTLQASQVNELEQRVQALRDMVAQGYVPTAEERALEDQLTQLKGAAQMGISGMEGQGRGMVLDLVRGKQAKLTEQANLQAQTLIDQLTNLQTERLAQQQAAMTQLGYAQEDIDRATSQAQQETQNQISLVKSGFIPYADEMEVPEGALTYNIGGQTYYIQPAKEEAATDNIAEYQFAVQQGYHGDFFSYLSDKQAMSGGLMTVGAGSSVIDPTTGQLVFQAPTSGGGLLEAPTVKQFGDQTYQWNGMTGTWDMIDVSAIPDASKINKAYDVVQAITDLENMAGLSSAVGAKGLSSFFGLKSEPIAGTAAADFVTQLNALKSLLTIENMGIMKGVLSDADIRILTQAATSLSTDMSEKAFRAELQRIKDKMTSVVAQGVGSTSQQGDDLDSILDSIGFNNDLSRSVKGSVLDLGPITGYGSDYWEYGLDIDLKKGDPVPAPASGTIEYVGPYGGFGNQVRIKTPNGDSVWLSHLDGMDVRVGDKVMKGQIVGRGGNTGSVIPLGGGDGSHLDLTVKKPDGSYYSAREVEQLVNRYV